MGDFFKTQVTVTLLTLEPLNGACYTLEEISEMIASNDAVENISVGESVVLSADEMLVELEQAGADPEIFGLSPDKEDAEE